MCPTMVESMGEGSPHWILGVGQGRGEYSIQKHCHPQPWWWCKAHSEADEASYWVLWGALSANTTKPCRLLGICVEPDVDHGAACTWHWISVKYHGPVVTCVEYFQWTWWLCWSLCEHERIHLVWMQGEELHQWGPMLQTFIRNKPLTIDIQIHPQA